MSVKSKRRERRKKAEKASPGAKAKANAGAEEESYSLNAILAEFRANKELEQAAEGIKPAKNADFDDFFDIPAPERAEEAPPGVAEPFAAEAGETPLDLHATAEAAESPFDAPAIAEAPEKQFDLFAAEESAEKPFDFFATEENPEMPPDTPALEENVKQIDSFAAEAVEEAPFKLSLEEESAEKTPFDLSGAFNGAGSGSDAPPVAAEAPDAASLSDTQTFSRVAPDRREDTTPPPTFRKRLFGGSKKRKPAKDTKEEGEPRSISLEEVVGNTVDAVKAEAILDGASGRRSLFSRRRMEDMADELPGIHPEIIGPEPDLKTAAAQNAIGVGSAREALIIKA